MSFQSTWNLLRFLSIDEPRKYQHYSNYKANQTPSSLPQVGRTRGANTFPLRNQSLALESLKDQLRFLETKILGGDSKEPNQQNRTKRKSPVECRKNKLILFIIIFFQVRQDGDSTGDPWTKLDLFVCLCYVLLVFVFL